VFPCNRYPIVVVVQRPRAPSIALRLILLRVAAQLRRKFVAWFKSYLEFIADGFEAVSFVFFVPHAFVGVDAMRLFAVIFLAVGASVFRGRLVVVLLLFLFVGFAPFGSFVSVASAGFAFLAR